MMGIRPIDANALSISVALYMAENAYLNDTALDILKMVAKWLEKEPTLDYAPVQKIDGNTSDGYHTFNELYHHRALLFSVIVSQFKDIAWKSKLHHDGTMYDGMFIVGVNTLQGRATYHYDIEPYWNMFNCKELERAPEWDGHTSEQAIERIASLRLMEPFKNDAPVKHAQWIEDDTPFVRQRKCSLCGHCDSPETAIRGHFCWYCGAKMDGQCDE